MHPLVEKKFNDYPSTVCVQLHTLRDLIFQVAKEDGVENLVETLKWNEPSYLAKSGSTIRFDWKAKLPDQYCLYFNCKTSLIETFKEVYGDTFQYAGNRAIIFKINDPIPTTQLKHCLSLSMRYHNLKHLVNLGC